MKRNGPFLFTILMLVNVVAFAGCNGDDDTSPGPANISGTWTGTQGSSTSGGKVTLVLVDNSGNVTGTRSYRTTSTIEGVPISNRGTTTVEISGTYEPETGRFVLTYVSNEYSWKIVYGVKEDYTMTIVDSFLYDQNGAEITSQVKLHSTLTRQS